MLLVSINNQDFQKQPPEAFYKNRYSWKLHKIHMKTSVPKSVSALIKLQALGLQLY